MNTHGHEEVAKEAGLPLLQEAFGRENRSLNAFYLGNWLTDVSQAVDPVAYRAGSAAITGAINDMIDGMKNAVDAILDEITSTTFTPLQSALRSLRPDLTPTANRLKQQLHAHIDFFFAMHTHERDSRVAVFLRDLFLLIGYFKFVHPEAANQPPRMDFQCYMQVFGRGSDARGASGSQPAPDRPGSYTQYYPHEHLDRPEILPSRNPPIYAPGEQVRDRPFRVAPGQQAGTRSITGRARIEPDMYSYTRDHIEMAAGLLAEVDLAFEEALTQGFRDNDPAWNQTLAKLGHALHLVEDFFAHSNWIELVIKRLGPQYLNRYIPPRTGQAWIDHAYTTYQRRLKRHLTHPLDDWRDHPDEDWVVTGFFDFRDTLISLAHMTEEFWGLDVDDPYASAHRTVQSVRRAARRPDLVVDRAKKVLRDTFEFITRPDQAIRDRDNEVARRLRDRFGDDVDVLRRPSVSRAVAQQVAREVSFLRGAPPEIQQAFFNVITEGTRVHRIGSLANTIYETLQSIGSFISNPIDFLAKWLPDRIKQQLQDALKFYARERVYELIGAGRIGCHSLLAKDHDLAVFYEQQKACAKAVHWIVVKQLVRWKDATERKYIDWLELLEFYLRNPLPPRAGSYRRITGWVGVTRVHTVRRGEQLRSDNPQYSLEHMYKPTAIEPNRFTWRTIADANFGTHNLPLAQAQRTINQILRENAWGVPVRPPNYAFKAGLKILIPQQKTRAIFYVPVEDTTPWYKDVLDHGWRVVAGFENVEGGTSEPPREYHQPREISRDQLQTIISRGRTLRHRARQAYRP